jgi:hypothetical protein
LPRSSPWAISGRKARLARRAEARKGIAIFTC